VLSGIISTHDPDIPVYGDIPEFGLLRGIKGDVSKLQVGETHLIKCKVRQLNRKLNQKSDVKWRSGLSGVH